MCELSAIALLLHTSIIVQNKNIILYIYIYVFLVVYQDTAIVYNKRLSLDPGQERNDQHVSHKKHSRLLLAVAFLERSQKNRTGGNRIFKSKSLKSHVTDYSFLLAVINFNWQSTPLIHPSFCAQRWTSFGNTRLVVLAKLKSTGFYIYTKWEKWRIRAIPKGISTKEKVKISARIWAPLAESIPDDIS